MITAMAKSEIGSTPMPAQAVTVVQPTDPMVFSLGPVIAWCGVLVTVAAAVAILYRLLTASLKRDIGDNTHAIKAVTGRVDTLEHQRSDEIGRIARLETSNANIEKSLDRIDRTMTAGFNQLNEAIRDIHQSH